MFKASLDYIVRLFLLLLILKICFLMLMSTDIVMGDVS